jgi:hypothetical protein
MYFLAEIFDCSGSGFDDSSLGWLELFGNGVISSWSFSTGATTVL